MSAAAISVSRPAPRVDPNAVLAVVAVAQFMVVLDASVVNVALPTIQRDVGFSEQSLSWVLNAYTLIFGGFLLLGGRARRPARPASAVRGRHRAVRGRVAALRASRSRRRCCWSPAACRASAARWSRRRRCRSSSRPSPRGPSATGRSRSGARSPAPAARSGCCSAARSSQVLSWRWVFFINVPIGAAVLVLAPRIVAREPLERRRAGGYDVEGAVTDHARHDGARLHADQGRHWGWTVGADARRGSRWPPRCSSAFVRIERRARGPAGPAAHLLQPQPRRLRRDDARWSPPRCSGCSSSARCTCSRCSATTRSRPASPTCR